MLMMMMMSGDHTRGQRPGAACEGRRPEVVATPRARRSESPPRTAAQYHTLQSVNINMWKYKMLPDSCSLMFAPAVLLRCHGCLFTTIDYQLYSIVGARLSSNTIKETIRVCVRSVSSFVLRCVTLHFKNH